MNILSRALFVDNPKLIEGEVRVGDISGKNIKKVLTTQNCRIRTSLAQHNGCGARLSVGEGPRGKVWRYTWFNAWSYMYVYSKPKP